MLAMENSKNKNDVKSEQTENQSAAKKPMTHEERLELAAKLDKELDEFIEKLPRRGYQDGWPEDRWEEVNIIICSIKCFL